MDIKFCVKHRGVVKDETAAEIEDFCKLCPPEEGEIYIFEDEIKRALFCECHIRAGLVISYGTIDVPLDAENQGEYRANRDVVEDSAAFIQMKEDALNGRSFSNIVAEYNTAFDGEHPLKIIGGQHRYIAIAEALERGVEKVHGVKVYFGLNMEQRLDVQLISNTNIAVSSDLLDRMLETVKGPQLRDWCQSAGLLREHEDFADRKQRGSRFTVRAARTFIMNYYEGSAITSKDFSDRKTTPVLAKTGGVDDEWERLKLNHPGMWEDAKLLAAGRAFSELMKKQKSVFTREDGKVSNGDYADKASSYAIVAAWLSSKRPTRSMPKPWRAQNTRPIRTTTGASAPAWMPKRGGAWQSSFSSRRKRAAGSQKSWRTPQLQGFMPNRPCWRPVRRKARCEDD